VAESAKAAKWRAGPIRWSAAANIPSFSWLSGRSLIGSSYSPFRRLWPSTALLSTANVISPGHSSPYAATAQRAVTNRFTLYFVSMPAMGARFCELHVV